MKQFPIKDELSHFQHLHSSGLAYELLRDILIPDLLGKDLPSILYWSGKNLARKYPVSTTDEIIHFFKDVGWGDLTIIEENANGMKLELSGEFITARNQSRKTTCYQLEAGFIAQQVEQMNQLITEAYEDQKKKSNVVHFTIKWDKKDTVI